MASIIRAKYEITFPTNMDDALEPIVSDFANEFGYDVDVISPDGCILSEEIEDISAHLSGEVNPFENMTILVDRMEEICAEEEFVGDAVDGEDEPSIEGGWYE